MRAHLFYTAVLTFGTLSLAAAPATAKVKRVSKKKPKKMNTQTPRFSHDGAKVSYEFHIPKKKHKGVSICTAQGKSCKNVEPDTGASAAGFDDDAPPPVRELAWHPQGRSYVYGSTGGRSTLNIYMEGEGCLSCEKSFGYGNKIHSTWSPDGKFLAFAVEDPATEHGEVYLIDIYNLEKGPTKLTNHEDDTSYQPRFSPDGKKLLFTRFNPEKSDNDLYVIDDVSDPKSVRKLTSQRGAELNGSWSPDGSKIAYYSVYERKGKTKTDLNVTPADGSGKHTVLAKGVVKPDLANPVWTADGEKILFVRDHEKRSNPVAWVSVSDPKTKGDIKTGTIQNSDLVGFPADEGRIKLLWTAQGKKADKEKTWRKVYTGTFDLP